MLFRWYSARRDRPPGGFERCIVAAVPSVRRFAQFALARAGAVSACLDRDFGEPANLQAAYSFDNPMSGSVCPKLLPASANFPCAEFRDVQLKEFFGGSLIHKRAELLSRFPLILDGTDNFETLFLGHDFAFQSGLLVVYAAAGLPSMALTFLRCAAQTACPCLLAGNRRHACPGRTFSTLVGVLDRVN